jgi:transposase InsO family protein
MAHSINVKTKRQLVQRYQSGESATALCQEASVPRSTFYYWTKIYHMQTTIKGNIVTPKAFDTLKKRLKKSEEITAILRSTDCLPSAPLRQKLLTAEALVGKYSKHVICAAFNISRGTFYNHILRNKRSEAIHAKRREDLKIRVKTIYDESRQIYGVGKIHAALVEAGHTISIRMVSSLMHEMGLYSIRQIAKKEYLAQVKREKKANLIKRNFQADAPNRVWVSDVTCFKVKDRYYYLCVAIDLYSRKVISHKVSKANNTHLVACTLRQALAYREPKGVVLHSDRGAPYVSYTIQKLLKDNGASQSLSNPGSPYDNAVAESFFNTIKREEYYRSNYKSEREFKECIENYVIFYNTSRPHISLNHQRPDQVEGSFQQR